MPLEFGRMGGPIRPGDDGHDLERCAGHLGSGDGGQCRSMDAGSDMVGRRSDLERNCGLDT